MNKHIILGDLANSLDHVKNILLMKMEPNTTQSQSELTAELDRTVKKSMGKNIIVFHFIFFSCILRTKQFDNTKCLNFSFRN